MNDKSLAESYEDLKDRRRHAASAADLASDLESIVGQHGLEKKLASFEKLGAVNLDFEYVVRLLETLALADRVFGDSEKAQAWLGRANASLSGQAPRDLLKDELGAAVVRETLEQIDHGIFA